MDLQLVVQVVQVVVVKVEHQEVQEILLPLVLLKVMVVDKVQLYLNMVQEVVVELE